jgi:hypothetical protein
LLCGKDMGIGLSGKGLKGRDKMTNVCELCERDQEIEELKRQIGALENQGVWQHLSEQEVHLLRSMIETHKFHAKRCETMNNRVMADRQMQYDLDKVAVLEKCLGLLEVLDCRAIFKAIDDEPEYPDAEKFISKLTTATMEGYGVEERLASALAEMVIECARISVRETKKGIRDRIAKIISPGEPV